MEEHPNAQEVRQVIEQRLSRYRTLFFDFMTPSLKKELHNAIKVHSEVLELPQPKVGDLHRVSKRLTELDDMDDHLMEHWAKVHRDLVSRSSLLVNMALFQIFIAAKLLEDYTGKAYSASPWVLSQATIVEQQSASVQQAGDKPLASAYQNDVVLPVEEILLDPEHVGEKLKAAATPQRHPGGDVQRLIDECDWPGLAATLVKDRELAVELFQQSALDPEAFDLNTSKKILRKIDDITAKYFDELSTASEYTLNNHAVQKSAGRGSGTKDPTSPDITPYREEPTLVAGARSLFDKLTNGLGLAGAGISLSSLGHNSSHTSLDDRTRLINVGKNNV